MYHFTDLFLKIFVKLAGKKRLLLLLLESCFCHRNPTSNFPCQYCTKQPKRL